MDMRDIGARIQRRREYLSRVGAGYTREEVAAKLGMTGAAYAHFEQGRREVGAVDLMHLGEILHCRIAYFFGQDAAPSSLIDLASGEPVAVRHNPSQQLATRADAEEIKQRLDLLLRSVSGIMPAEPPARDPCRCAELPPELEIILNLQSRIYATLPSARARTRYIESLRSQAETTLVMLDEQMEEEEARLAS
jgi:transcriptional regulator with XRE-family HTH domain